MILSKLIFSALRKKPANLAEWLTIATGDLVPAAQARVRAEIGAHYAEAVQGYAASGLSEAEAQRAALSDLGGARVASRNFRRTLGTKREAHYFAALLSVNKSILARSASVGMLALAAYFFGRYTLYGFIEQYMTSSCLFWLGVAGIQVSLYLTAKRPSSRTAINGLLLLELLEWVPIMFMTMPQSSGGASGSLVYFGFLIFLNLKRARKFNACHEDFVITWAASMDNKSGPIAG